MREFLSSPRVQRVLYIVGISVGVLLAAVVVSVLVPRIVALASDIRSGLRAMRVRLAEYTDALLGRLVPTFWAERQTEPRAPVVLELARVADAVSHIGAHQVGEIRTIEGAIRREVATLSSLGMNPSGESAVDLERLTAGVARTSGAWGALILALVGAILVGGINSFLLNIFFRETLGSMRMLPYPLPDIQISNVVALIFFVVEVFIGLLLHAEVEQGNVMARLFRRIGPAVALFGLLLVEIVAYSVLSVRINVPQRLGMDATSAFLGLARYFFAFFGAGITLVLAGLGYQIAHSLERIREGRASRVILRTLGNYSNRLQAAKEHSEELIGQLTRVTTATKQLPSSITESFQDAVGQAGSDFKLSASIKAALVSAIGSADRVEDRSSPRIRTRTQVLGDVLIAAAIAVTLTFAAWLTINQLGFFLAAVQPKWIPAFPFGLAILIVTGAIVVGFTTRNALAGSRYATPTQTAIPSPARRKKLGYALLAVCGCLGAFFIFAAVAAGQAGVMHPALSVLIGLLEAVFLVGLGAFLDQAAVGTWHLGQLVGYGAIQVGAVIGAALALVLDAFFATMCFLLKLLAVPGDAIRSVFSRRRSAEIRPLAVG